MSNFEKVRDFYLSFNGIPEPQKITTPEFDKIALRFKLVIEEFNEVKQEIESYPINHQRLAKEIADLLYVVYGLGSAFGYPMDEIFKDVHNSNMSKLGPDGKPIYREDGKIIKSSNYKPADLSYLIEKGE